MGTISKVTRFCRRFKVTGLREIDSWKDLPLWDATDTRDKVAFAENSVLLKALPGVGQNVALHAYLLGTFC